jgi:hypothetical protein
MFVLPDTLPLVPLVPQPPPPAPVEEEVPAEPTSAGKKRPADDNDVTINEGDDMAENGAPATKKARLDEAGTSATAPAGAMKGAEGATIFIDDDGDDVIQID